MSSQRHSKRPRRYREEDSYLWDQTPTLSPEEQSNAISETSVETLPSRGCPQQADASVSKSQTEFQADMYRRFNIIEKRLLQVQATQRRILAKLRTSEVTLPTASTAPIQMGISIPLNPVEQPIACRAAFRDLHERLLNPHFSRELESYLSCLGGRNTDDFVKRIFYAIFDDAIALELNFQGRKGKDALSGSKFYELITELYVRWNGGGRLNLYELEAAFVRRLKLPFYECHPGLATSTPNPHLHNPANP